MGSLAISYESSRTPRVKRAVFVSTKEAVLGKSYELSLSFISSARSKALNKRYRGKNKPANVLSFPLEKKSGEILICPAEARRQAPDFGESAEHFVFSLFIHGLFHLKGLRHGGTMERRERTIKNRFRL